MDNLIIGIAGGTGSGKSTLTENIKQRFGDDVTVLLHDYYYKAHDELTYEERTQLNYDVPSAYDTDLMVRDLELLKRGQKAYAPVYDFAIYNRRPETRDHCVARPSALGDLPAQSPPHTATPHLPTPTHSTPAEPALNTLTNVHCL